MVTFLSLYAPQSSLSDEVKDQFFDQLRAMTARIPGSEFLIPCGDWNGKVGCAGTGYREVHGGMGVWQMLRVRGFVLLLGNTCFKNHDSHFTTYRVGKQSHADRPHLLPQDHEQTRHRSEGDPWPAISATQPANLNHH